MTSLTRLAGAALCAAFASTSVSAEGYPDKTVTMIVPFNAGGGTDTVARIAVPGLEEQLGQEIIVKNVAGAGGTVGATELAASSPDGYTIGFMPIGTMTTQPHLRNVAYGGDSWEPICRLVDDPMSVLVAPDSKLKTFDDILSAASDGGQLLTAGPPPGSLPHIGQAALANAYDLDFRYVPHEGGAAVAKSILGGQVDVFVDLAGNAQKFGLVNIALMGSERHPAYPDLATTEELGGTALPYSIWFGMFAPAGTPDDVMAKLAGACEALSASEAYLTDMEEAGRWVAFLDREDFTAFFAEQFANNGALLEAIVPK